MFKTILNWLNTRFANPELLILIFSLIFLVLFLHYMGGMLAPVFASVILAYLLDGIVKFLERWKIPRGLAVTLVWLLFVGVLLVLIFVLLPIVWQQLGSLLTELPTGLKKMESFLLGLPQRYPDYISSDQITRLSSTFQADFSNFGKLLVSYSLSTLFNIITLIVYLILVPLMVLFFLKDSKQITKWFSAYLPKKRRLIQEVWGEVNLQIGNYIRAKMLEIFIVFVACLIPFMWLGLNYALLLAALAGISALVPYVGVIVVTIPVLVAGYLQWGLSAHFGYLVLIYGVIMALDGNVLSTLLFSESVKIHPVAVIVAIIIFGGIWGFWGVFFAIPLATLVKAVLNVWINSETA